MQAGHWSRRPRGVTAREGAGAGLGVASWAGGRAHLRRSSFISVDSKSGENCFQISCTRACHDHGHGRGRSGRRRAPQLRRALLARKARPLPLLLGAGGRPRTRAILASSSATSSSRRSKSSLYASPSSSPATSAATLRIFCHTLEHAGSSPYARTASRSSASRNSSKSIAVSTLPPPPPETCERSSDWLIAKVSATSLSVSWAAA